MKSSDPVFSLLVQSFGQDETLTVPRALVTLTGDIKTALLLSQIIYWSRIKADEDGWFYKSYPDWEREIALTKHEVARATEDLKAAEVVETRVAQVRGNGAPTVHYRIRISGFRRWIVKKAEMDSEKTGDPIVKKPEINKEQKNTTEEYIQKTTDASDPAPSGKTKNQNPPTEDFGEQEQDPLSAAPPPITPPESGASSIDLEDDLVTFIANVYSRNHRTTPKLKTKQSAWLVEQLRTAEVSMGAVEFRTALTEFVQEDSAWQRENKWPLPTFLKNIDTVPRKLPAKRAAPPTPRIDTPDCAARPAGPVASILPDYVLRWNAALPEAQREKYWNGNSPKEELVGAMADPEFIENFDSICAKCCSVIAAGRYKIPGFTWLLDRAVGKRINWWRILHGQFAWAETSADTAKPINQPKTNLELARERLEKAIKEKEKPNDTAKDNAETASPVTRAG